MGESFVFFNKMDGVPNDLNSAFTLAYQNVKNLLLSIFTQGFINDSNFKGFNFNTKAPICTQGISGLDYINVSIGGCQIIGIDNQQRIIIIDTDEVWKTSPTIGQNSGNMNIPLTADTKPYTNWIWIKYKQLVDQSTSATRVDYDGGTHQPFQYDGYEIIVLNIAPNVPGGVPIDALYIGKMDITSTTQTFDPTDQTGYSGQQIAGVKDNAVKIQPSSLTKTSNYVDGNTMTLKDHVNAIGNGIISSANPHGSKISDIGIVGTTDITDHSVTETKLTRVTDSAGAAVGTAEIQANAVTEDKLSKITDTAGAAIGTAEIQTSAITDIKLAIDAKVPVGTIVMWTGTGNLLPSNWMICDGRGLKKTDYATLAGILGQDWGAPYDENGNGLNRSIYFKIPDLRGMFVRGAYVNHTGWNPVYGGDPDKATRKDADGNTPYNPVGPASYQEDALQDHKQLAPSNMSSYATFDNSASPGGGTGTPNHLTLSYTSGTVDTSTARTTTETRGMNAYLYYIIKVK